jgi:hypothetical protein
VVRHLRAALLAALAFLAPLLARAADVPGPTPAPVAPLVAPAGKGAPSSAPAFGVEALCAGTLSLVDGTVAAHSPVRLTVQAEGATLDIAEPIRERCSALLVADGHGSGAETEDALVRIRVRAAPPSLIAFVDVGTFAAPASMRTDTISVPLGAAMEAWLSAAGTVSRPGSLARSTARPSRCAVPATEARTPSVW